jgi:hypothetical protein
VVLGIGAPANWIVVDIFRIDDGVLLKHWDVIQDEALREQENANNLIRDLTLEFNTQRPGNITKELLDLAGGQAESA